MKKTSQNEKKLSSQSAQKLITGLAAYKILTKLKFRVILEEEYERSYRIVLGLAKYPQLSISFSLAKSLKD
jgi:hypothetical protein